MRRAPRATYAVAAGLGVALACGPITLSPGPPTPINECPAHACSAYVQPGDAPSCNGGVCTVSTAMNDLVLVIALPTDSYVAPGRTYVTTLSIDSMISSSSCDSEDAGVTTDGQSPCAMLRCSPPCCLLPRFVEDKSSYVVTPDDAVKVNWYPGNSGVNTTFPVEATYRLLWGTTGKDAASLGLPLTPVSGLPANPGGASPPGPFNAPPIGSEAFLPPGCYERTLQPFAPLSQAYPPDIHTFPPSTNAAINGFDTTTDMTGGPSRSLPEFQITRANGLDGWTAYLRNQETHRVFSNAALLSGSLANVTLVTSYLAPGMDALTGLELVVAPPPGTPLPSYVAAPAGVQGKQVLVSAEPYPALPTPVMVTGQIATVTGSPVEADLVFTATDITDPSGIPFPSSSFEFVARARATPDPKRRASSYSVLLPRGDYQVVALPRDGVSALTTVSRHVGGTGNEMTNENVIVGSLSRVTGRALVTDRRPLASAIVEVVPTACGPGAVVSVQAMPSIDPPASCMPRPAQTTTATDGSFVLGVDPGSYLLRVRPAYGSRLPWMMQSIVVGLGSSDLAEIEVPAPVQLSMTLLAPPTSCTGDCVGNAVVRVFTYPSSSAPAIELGSAIADSSGHFELYLAPPAQ
jgi:hypothetical protein